MSRAVAVAVALVAVGAARTASPQGGRPDDLDPGDERFRAATLRGAGDPDVALAELLAIADELPDSAWADDALVEAARLLERAGDLDRAVAVLDRVADRYPTSRSARWARDHAAALAARTAGGAFTAVATEHDALVGSLGRHGDPTATLERLGVLLRAHPGYPRAQAGRIWLGDAWGRQGDWTRALAWYRDAAAVAPPGARGRAGLRIAAALVGLDDFAEAGAAIEAAAADPAVDPLAITRARADLERHRARHRARAAAWIALAVLAAIAAIGLRRGAGSIRAAARALVRPPVEVWYLAPIALFVVAVALEGNPLVAAGVWRIALGGLVLAWVSGAVLRATPRPGAPRVAVHLVALAIAAVAIVYLAVARDRLLDMLIETWRHGPG